MLGAFAYLIILSTSIAALIGAPWIVIGIGAVALTIVSLVEHRQYRSRFAAVGMGEVFQTFALSNAGTGLLAATAAYLLGSFVRLVAFG